MDSKPVLTASQLRPATYVPFTIIPSQLPQFPQVPNPLSLPLLEFVPFHPPPTLVSRPHNQTPVLPSRPGQCKPPQGKKEKY